MSGIQVYFKGHLFLQVSAVQKPMLDSLAPNSKGINVKWLETKLEQQHNPRQRLILLDRLAAYYTYNNPQRALIMIEEAQTILQTYPLPDLEMSCLLNLAMVHNQRYDYLRSEEVFKNAISMLEERGSVQELAEACIDYAGTCMNLEKFVEARQWLDKANRSLRNYPDKQLMGRLACRQGFVLLRHNNLAEAMELFLEADSSIQASEKPAGIKDSYFLTLVHSGLGKIYELNGDYGKCIDAYRKVIDICDTWGIRSRLAWHYLNLGSAFLAMEDHSQADYYFRLSLENSDDLSKDARAGAFANLGICCLSSGNYEEALQLFDKAEEDYRAVSQDDFNNFCVIASWRGRLYAELGYYDEAIRELANAYALALRVMDYRQLAVVCRTIASVHADREDYRQAYEYQLLHDEYTMKYVDMMDKRHRAELEVKYESAKQHRETELLKLQATQLQLKALRAQMNPHFLYNALNSIQGYITSHDASTASKYLAKFAKLMRQSLEYSDMEIISLEKEVAFLEDYLFINEKLRFEDRLRYKITVDEQLEDDILGVPTMIVQPYVENAIEHGLRSKKDGLVTVNFSLLDEDTILCVVEDNGIGREKARLLQLESAQNHRSRGTQITEMRLKILHQSPDKGVLVNTIDLVDPLRGEAQGTRVEIKIPILEIDLH